MCFDVSRQRRGQSAVSGISQSFVLKVCSKFSLTSRGLQPFKPLARAADRARYTACDANGKWPGRFVAAHIRISELRRVETNGSEKLWHDTVSDGFSSEWTGNEFDIVDLSQLDQRRVPKAKAPNGSFNESLE